MKRSIFAVAALATTFAAGAVAHASQQSSQPPSAPSPASASGATQPTGATKIAVIAFQPAVASTNEGRQAFQKIQQRFQPKQAELKALNDQINTLKKQLQDSGASLSQSARATQLQTIDDKEKTLQREAQDAQGDFQQAMQESYQTLAQKFYPVLQDYAQRHGYGIVIDTSSQQTPVVWASKSADITAAVIREYNERSGIAAPASTSTHTTTHRHTTAH